MQIRKFTLGPFRTNGYLLSDSGQAVFIDPGDNPAEVLAVLKEEGLQLTHVLITHMHLDHFYGAAKLAAVTGAEVLASSEDGFMVDTEIRDGGNWGYPELDDEFSFSPLEVGEREFLGRKCQVIATPGHTPGGLTFHFSDEGVAFVGDLIFMRSIGRTDFPGGDVNALMHSIHSAIFTMPGETVLYSGHGPSTTVADEKAHNPYVQPGATR